MNNQTVRNLPEIDWNSFFTMIKDIGGQLNSRKLRFDKADLVESALEKASGGRLKWVDEEGCDHVDRETNDRYEVKTMHACLYTKKGVPKPNRTTKSLKLTNTLSQREDLKLNNTSDYLLIIDTNPDGFSAAIVDYKLVVEKYSTQVKDGFTCAIPYDDMQFLIRPGDITLHSTRKVIKSYAEEKANLQREYVSGFFN